jgi:hypothetical protein
MRENDHLAGWRADTDLEMANHCMELAALRSELDDLKVRHTTAVHACMVMNSTIKILAIEMENMKA